MLEGWSALAFAAIYPGLLGAIIVLIASEPRYATESIMSFALLAFGQVFGFFGVLLALPASAALLVGLPVSDLEALRLGVAPAFPRRRDRVPHACWTSESQGRFSGRSIVVGKAGRAGRCRRLALGRRFVVGQALWS